MTIRITWNDDRGYVERNRKRQEASDAMMAGAEAEVEALRASGGVCPDHPYDTVNEDGSHVCLALGCYWRDGVDEREQWYIERDGISR